MPAHALPPANHADAEADGSSEPQVPLSALARILDLVAVQGDGDEAASWPGADGASPPSPSSSPRPRRDLFIGTNLSEGLFVPTRVFGGQLVGQALVAASRTVRPGLAVNSLHAYFLAPGDPRRDIAFAVTRTRDGRSFATRSVVARQAGGALLALMASFHAPEEGFRRGPKNGAGCRQSSSPPRRHSLLPFTVP